MANTNIQSSIPLVGPGFREKDWGTPYAPGEYARLQDVIYDSNGNLVNRPAINRFSLIANTALDRPRGIIGTTKSRSIVNGGNQIVVLHDGSASVMSASDANLPKDTGGQHYFIGFFDYNEDYYMISYEFLNATGTWKLNVWKSSYTTLYTPQSVTYASLTKYTAASGLASTGAPPTMKTFFIHKDRLWIVTEENVYYSKATDPTNWTVGAGLAGSFKIPDAQINSAFAHSDTVYILSDQGIYVLSYATDIDTDGYLRKLTTASVDAGVVHNNQIYVMSMEGLFLLQGGFTQKIFALKDVEAYDHGQYDTKFKLQSWGNQIHILKYVDIEYSDYSATSVTNGDTGKIWYDYGAAYNYNWIVYDTVVGATSIYAFTDQRDRTNNGSTSGPGYVCDIAAYNYFPGIGTQGIFHLVTNAYVNKSTYDHQGYCYYLAHEMVNPTSWDIAIDSSAASKNYAQRQEIEIRGYAPDGNKNVMKKFRGIVLNANFADHDFYQIQFGFDQYNYGTAMSFPEVDDTPGTGKTDNPPYAYRFPINQRGRCLNIKIKPSTSGDTPLASTPVKDSAGNEYGRWSISDIRIYWNQTQRLPEVRGPDLT